MTDQEFVDAIEKYRHEFYRYILRNVWNPSVAEDVFSSGVLAAYKQLEKFQDGTNFRAWLYKILTNKCFVANRETKRSAINIESVDEQSFTVNDALKNQIYDNPEWFFEQCGDALFQALRQLSTAQRSCFLLLAVERYSYKEIARIMEIPLGTVMTHLARGRAKLRRLLLDYAAREGILSADSKYIRQSDTESTEAAS